MKNPRASLALALSPLLGYLSCDARASAQAVVALADPGSEPGDPPAAPASDAVVDRAAVRQKLRALTVQQSYFDLAGTLMLGDGIRFNNPYRLSRELGQGGQSLSSTAPYLDLALSAAAGRPDGLQHGARLGWSISLSGVPQHVVTPAYQAVLRLRPAWLLYGWAGLPVILSPDANVGGEIAVGGAWLARAGLGAAFAVVADGFYGAGTRETRAALYPVLSAQVGLLVGYEVLP